MFREEMINSYHTKKESPLYAALLQIFAVPNELKRIDGPDVPIAKNDVMCVLCNSVFSAYIDEIRNGATEEQMTEMVLELCVTLQLQSERVCRGLIELNIGTFMYIINARPNLQPDQMCGIIFQNLNCAIEDASIFEYSINVDQNKPALQGSKDTRYLY